MNKITLAFISSAILLTGCSTMDAQDCQSANWEMIGMKDGENGKLLSTFGEYSQQCNEFGVNANRQLYEKGRDYGLTTFCTKDRGFSEGRQQNQNNNVCPAPLQSAFNQGYGIGLKYAAISREISNIESEIWSLNDAIKDKNKALEKQEKQLDQQEDVVAATKAYLKDFKKAQKRITKWKVQIEQLKHELAVQEYQYQELVNQFGYQ